MSHSLWPNGYWTGKEMPQPLQSQVITGGCNLNMCSPEPAIQVATEIAGPLRPHRQEKWWGHELTYYNTDRYCSKLLCFKANGHTSMHFHVKKHETLVVIHGTLTLEYIEDKEIKVVRLLPGTAWVVPPGHPHRLIAAEGEVSLMESSTTDFAFDSIRIS